MEAGRMCLVTQQATMTVFARVSKQINIENPCLFQKIFFIYNFFFISWLIFMWQSSSRSKQDSFYMASSVSGLGATMDEAKLLSSPFKPNWFQLQILVVKQLCGSEASGTCLSMKLSISLEPARCWHFSFSSESVFVHFSLCLGSFEITMDGIFISDINLTSSLVLQKMLKKKV